MRRSQDTCAYPPNYKHIARGEDKAIITNHHSPAERCISSCGGFWLASVAAASISCQNFPGEKDVGQSKRFLSGNSSEFAKFFPWMLLQQEHLLELGLCVTFAPPPSRRPKRASKGVLGMKLCVHLVVILLCSSTSTGAECTNVVVNNVFQ